MLYLDPASNSELRMQDDLAAERAIHARRQKDLEISRYATAKSSRSLCA